MVVGSVSEVYLLWMRISFSRFLVNLLDRGLLFLGVLVYLGEEGEGGAAFGSLSLLIGWGFCLELVDFGRVGGIPFLCGRLRFVQPGPVFLLLLGCWYLCLVDQI